MATLTLRDVRKSFGGVEVLKGIDLEAGDGEFVALVGPSGCGKSTLLAMIAGLEKRHLGRDLDRRPHGQLGAAQGPRHRHGVPVLRALPDDDRAREHHLRHGEPPRPEAGAGRGRRPRRRAAADRAAPEAQARPALRRPAPARRHGPGAGARPGALPLRRAALQPRRQAPRRHAHRDQEAAPPRRQVHRLRHPRPGRGDDARLAHRRHAQGRAAAVRRAARPSTAVRPTSSSPASWARRR